MKQRIILLVSFVLLAVQGWASPVDESSARAIVKDFLNDASGCTIQSIPSSSGSTVSQLVHTEVSSVNVAQNAYYIFNTSSGFVIVAGDDRAERILGYGDDQIDMSQIPCAMQFMLDSYKEQIDYLLAHPGLVVETPSMNAPKLTATTVGPLLTCKWNQKSPYWNLCPKYNNSRCVTGCCCVALCQVMYYHQHEQQLTAVPSVPAYTTGTHKIYRPELPSTEFHWNYILPSYSGSYTADQAYSIAKLMLYVGQAEKMDYSPGGSGSHEGHILEAAQLFGYNRNADIIFRDDFSDAQWAAKIRAELDAKRPIVMCGGNSSGSEGHAFNVDGYRTSDNRYHVNWGWGGYCDGYYALNAFNPAGSNFNHYQTMIVGLKLQDPVIEVTPTSLSFNANVGETKKATFTVKGYALKGNLTVKLNNGGTAYRIDKTSITMSDATYSAKVTVTYKPTTRGSSSASVTISGGGAAAKTVRLSGTATMPEFTVDPASLSFSAVVGETQQDLIYVKGVDLEGDLTLKLNNGGNIFSIEETSIPGFCAEYGCYVIVTYKPKAAGSSSASLTISGGGANPKTVNLSGTAVDPLITATPSSPSFITYPGKPVSQTITIGGAVLGDLALTLNDNSGTYSIDKTSITASEIASGAMVTVTYNPTTVGVHNASITVSGGGAEDKMVILEGSAVIPVITTDVSEVTFDATYTGYDDYCTILITATDLLSDLQLSFSKDYNHSFGLSRQIITPEEAAIGAKVTINFSPTSGGGKHATLNIKSDGAETVTIPVNGTAIKSAGYITASEDNLSFETQVGTSVTKTFEVTYSKNVDDGFIVMISSVDNEIVSNAEDESEGDMPKLKASKRITDLTRIFTDTLDWRKRVYFEPFPLIDCILLKITLTGDDSFNIPAGYRFGKVTNCVSPNTYRTKVSVTYHPDAVGENEAYLKISIKGKVKPLILPLHGTATAQSNDANSDIEDEGLMMTSDVASVFDVPLCDTEPRIITDVEELAVDAKIYAEGLNIIIESPVEQSAMISDISGRARSVNLQAGRNEVPVNASGIYIVRVREKTVKLMLK